MLIDIVSRQQTIISSTGIEQFCISKSIVIVFKERSKYFDGIYFLLIKC